MKGKKCFDSFQVCMDFFDNIPVKQQIFQHFTAIALNIDMISKLDGCVEKGANSCDASSLIVIT